MTRSRGAAAPSGPGLSVKITAAICTYNRYHYLQESIEALRLQSLPPDQFEIIVVDNSPDRRISEEEAGRYSGIENLRWIYEATPGLSNARNVATAAARAPYLAFIDDDAIAVPDWLVSIITAFETFGPKVDVIGGPIAPRWPEGRPGWIGDDLLPYLSVVELGPEARLLHEHEWLAGANVSYRRDRLREVGGFNVALGRVGPGISLMSNDETELAERIKRIGGQVAYCPDARVEHYIDPSRLTQDWFRRRAAWQAVSAYVEGPGAMYARAPTYWRYVKEFMANQPPADRTVRALTLPRDSSDELQAQMGAIYNTVICLLSGMTEDNAA